MIILRQKEYGKVWEGTKSALRSGAKGAMIGATLMPGKIIALKKNKPKVALGLAGAGAIIGGAIGAKIGYSKGVDKYKYENDPEYKKKINKEREQAWKNNIQFKIKKDLSLASEFDYNSWLALRKKGIDIPDEFLKYVKFYKNIWAKNIKPWYDSITPISDEEISDHYYDILDFKSMFPLPINPKLSEEWYKYELKIDSHDLCLAYGSNAGDDGYYYYNTETGNFGIDGDCDTKSLKQLILDTIKYRDKDYKLSNVQKNMIREFKNKINTL